jgi:hypothetical protein
MNSAHTVVYTNPATQPGVLAPISRIGAGEVRVDRALKLTAIAHNPKARSAALPFGFAEVARSANLGAELMVENFDTVPKTFTIASSYRYADDEASGATTLEYPKTVTVPAGGSAKIDVRLKVDGTRLPDWTLNGGSRGGDGFRLQGVEVDGFLTLTSGDEALSVPFHALLRKSASLNATGQAVKAGNVLRLQNNAANAGAFDVFALTGTSPRANPTLRPGPGDSYALVDLEAVGVRLNGSVLQFAVSRHDRRAHPAYPAGIEIQVDTDRDGTPDFAVYNVESGAFASSGQTIVGVANLATGGATAFFFLDADLQSGNGIYSVPLAALGLTPASTFDFLVLAYDNYFTGAVTDVIEGMTFTPGTPRFAIADGSISGGVGGNSTVGLPTTAPAGGATASPSQTGFLLLYRANEGREAQTVKVTP